MDIKINCHSSICVNGEIWFDPFRVDSGSDAKLIFVTHSHWDHFSVEDIKKILSRQTIIICPKSMQSDIDGVFDKDPKEHSDAKLISTVTDLDNGVKCDKNAKTSAMIFFLVMLSLKKIFENNITNIGEVYKSIAAVDALTSKIELK